MKKLIAIAVSVLIVASLATAAYMMGWLAKVGMGRPGAPSSVAGAQMPGGGTQPGAPGASSTPGEATSAAAGEPAAGTPGAAAANLIPAPRFDGNIALIDFGGTVERTTDNNYRDTVDHRYIIDGDLRTNWDSVSNHPGIGEVVLSFFGREPALVDAVNLRSDEAVKGLPRDVEVWVSTAATPDGPFTKVASVALPLATETSVPFAPVEVRFLKFRMLKNHENQELFHLGELQVHEAQRAGYVPLMTRHPELALAGGPVPLPGGLPVVSTTLPVCRPATGETVETPAHNASSHVLVVGSKQYDYGANRMLEYAASKRLDDGVPASDFTILTKATITQTAPEGARPAMLAPALGVDTVVLAQLCDLGNTVTPAFKQALMAWVAAGHKLILEDSDDCVPGPDYSFIPYPFVTDTPGARGAPGFELRFIEFNAMLHGRAGRRGFLDVKAWVNETDGFRNELGDANTFVKWDGNWCGHLAVRNTNNVFGFSLAYAHYGRGLIIYDGFDNDQGGERGYDTLLTRELAQPFDPDNLPCGARLGDFVLTTDSWLLYRAVAPGRTYSYPLSLLSNLGYKGTVNLAVASSPALNGLQARIEPASVALNGEGQSALTITLPAGTTPPALALEVKGTDAAGKTNALCLQLGPARNGDLSVVSALAPPSKHGRNLEIILDASGSMKTLMGKKTRWDVALDTLQQVLAKLPDDFNVGLRIYGHREPSTSPRTCTDSELIVPIDKLNRQNILDRAKAFKPKGETPLVYSALQSPEDLRKVGGGTVILITDGEESCKGDTVKAAADLKASGLDIRLNIVGFALTNPKTQKDLAGFSQATGGLFYAAQSGAALGDALLVAAIEKFPYTVYDAAGTVVVTGEAGSPPEQLPAGDYKVVVKAGGQELVAPRVTLVLGQSVTLRIVMKGDRLVLE
jgi:hypothetical protein